MKILIGDLDLENALREFEKIKCILNMTTFETSLERKYPNFCDCFQQVQEKVIKAKR